jgi:DNA-binding MarR family transcriptional regulator
VDDQNVKKAELLGLKLMKASEMIQNAAQALFKQHGLSAPQYNVLRILRGAGGEGLNCQEISARMITRVPDITRLLDRLEDKKLVERRRLDTDRRVVMAEVTSTGLALLKDIDRPLDRQVRDHFRSLAAADLDRLDGLMDILLDGLKQD